MPVQIIEKDLSSIEPSHNDVMQRSGGVHAGFSGHVNRVADQSNCVNRKSEERPLCPFLASWS
jgi:hypothetical protein